MELSDHGHSLTLQMTAFVRFFSRLVLVVACCSAALAARADNDVRFSATLTPAQRERAGLTQLNADNVAVIDGLVRQDEAASKFRDNDVDRTRFSERRTPREREIAGLEHLSASQLTALDDLVGRRIAGAPLADATVVATGTAGASAGVKPNLTPHQLDIHGEMSFTYGWGKGGSFTGGDLVLNYDDPEGRYAVQVGYSEYHGKGLAPCFAPGYGLYRGYPAGFSAFR